MTLGRLQYLKLKQDTLLLYKIARNFEQAEQQKKLKNKLAKLNKILSQAYTQVGIIMDDVDVEIEKRINAT